MPGHQYTQSEFALQKVVQSFGNLVLKLVEHQLTHTYTVVFHFCQLENIDYLVLRYLNSGLLHCEEFSEERLHDREV